MADPTHSFTVEGIGDFVFRRRNHGHAIRIRAEADRILGGPVHSEELRYDAIIMATLDVLVVSAPEGWSVKEADPLDPATFNDIGKVYGRLRVAEDEFRSGPGAKRPDVGAGT